MSGTDDALFVDIQTGIDALGDFQIFTHGSNQSMMIHGKCFDTLTGNFEHANLSGWQRKRN
jgi:hypothetical protein